MKRFLAALLLIPALALGAGNDLLINQRNPTDTATLTRAVVPPSGGGVNGVMGYNGATNLPVFFRFGAGLALDSGAVVALPQAWADITGKPILATVATSGAYADLSGKPVLFSGAYADLTGIPATFAPAAHTQAWSTITSTPITLAGYGISDGVTQTALAATLGGYATTAALTSGLTGKFNTPTGTAAQYLRGDGSAATFPAIPGGTVTSITAGTGLAGGTITTIGTISLPNTGTAGSYANVTTDAQGRVTAGTNRSQSSVTRPLNTAFQPNTTRDVDARYSLQCQVTASITGGQNCDVFLEIATDQAFTTNVQQVGVVGQGQVYTLAIALQGVQPQTQQVIGYIPAGYWARIRTVQNLGAPTFTYRLGQEILQ
ncbi:hypothetical protein ACNFBR_10555 [Pseudomonas sp. NY11955]|uniref:hypothetical protein n=1 Tax=Pseudomonas sp. NY11955 TaxID=3400363 RepID=UPI003A8A4030